MLTDTILEDDRWAAVSLSDLAETAACATLRHLGLDPDCHEIAILACDDARIAALNADFRGKPQPTNVLSWPETDLAPEADGALPIAPETGSPEAPALLGDIALAFDTCMREAREAGLSEAAHVTHLVVHGVLHLLGYDHERDGDASLMERLEVEILGKLGVADPYRDHQGP